MKTRLSPPLLTLLLASVCFAQARPSWTTSQITGSPDPPAPYRLQRVFPEWTFNKPVVLTDVPGNDRMLLVELSGKIYWLPADPAGKQRDLFFDLKAHVPEATRVYGLAFSPNFAQDRACYVCYITKNKDPQGTKVSRFRVSKTEPPQIVPDSEEVLLTWLSGGHNGGCLKFGPDGFLYISTGDASPPFPADADGVGQDVGNLLSCVLRVDVGRKGNDRPYAIPADNPFVDLEGARPEIWAYGFRNPWKMSFDPDDGSLWVGDVGWEMWEMIYRVQRGGNYGWSLVEGSQPVHVERTRGPTPVLPPTIEHSHTESRSITGGFVYRGKRLKDLVGFYIYGDYVTGKLWALRHDGKKVVERLELADTSLPIICFGVDHDNELYVVSYTGEIYQLAPAPVDDVNQRFPTKLSETGLFASVADHQVAAGVVPYEINAEPWADGAQAERFVALPGDAKLGVHQSTNVQVGFLQGQWKFPVDGVLMKTLSMETEPGNSKSLRRLETQILHLDQDTWRAYSYVWNEQQTDAELAPSEGVEIPLTIRDSEEIRKQTWRVVSRSQCLLCHSTRGGSVYGFQPEQLSGLDATKDALGKLERLGLFVEKPKRSRRMVSPHDKTADLEQRARAYLHVNCAHCHRRGGGGTAALELQHHLPMEKTHLLDGRPTQGAFNIHAAEVLAPGDPYRSVLYYRTAKLGRGRMPHFGSHVVDRHGVELLHDWIAKMQPRQTPESVEQLRRRQRQALQELTTAEAFSPPARQAAETLLDSPSGALIALRAIERGSLPAPIRQAVLKRAAAHPRTTVRDLFERFLPEQQRTKRLGDSIDAQTIFKLSGNAQRGEALFFSTAGVQCKNCHKVGSRGIELGPDLTKIGKKHTREQLLESILKPSKQMDPKFRTYMAETSTGRVYTGLLVEKNSKQVVLKDAKNHSRILPAAEIELLTPLRKSLMPELLLREMTAQQAADLLAYLQGLR